MHRNVQSAIILKLANYKVVIINHIAFCCVKNYLKWDSGLKNMNFFDLDILQIHYNAPDFIKIYQEYLNIKINW